MECHDDSLTAVIILRRCCVILSCAKENSGMLRFLSVYLCLFILPSAIADEKFNSSIKPFLKEYCIGCHGPEKQKGDRRYDALKADFKTEDSAVMWRDILDQLLLEEMPPKKPFPANEKSKEVINWITSNFKKIRDEQAVSKNGTVLRRLSHMEYTNALKDLFKIDLPNFDLTRGLTEDNILHGFDTDAKQLKATPYLFSKYLEIADRFIDKSLPAVKPRTVKTVYPAKALTAARDNYLIKDGKISYLDLTGRTPDASRSYIRNAQSPEDATYKIRINAQALDRSKNWKLYRTPKPGIPWILKIIATSDEYGPIGKPNPADYDITTLHIEDNKKDYEFEAFLRKGYQLVFYWENGGGGDPNAIQVQKKHFKEVDYIESKEKIGKSNTYLKFYHGPKLRINEIEVDGPYFKQWPLKPVVSVFGKNPPEKPDMSYVKMTLFPFASKAWRRPAKDEELKPVYELVSKTLDKEGYRAIAKGMKAILCSPGFLYHYQNNGKLDNFALASRLSFFLWGTSPDHILLRHALKGDLTDAAVYRQEVARMLKDPRTDNFIKHFSYQWLNLKKAGEMPPDENKFRKYYSMNINEEMIHETNEFLKTLLNENLSIYNCLDSDFAVLNENMANYYGLSGVKGKHYRKVALPKNSIRGGLLTQASVLTATSNGVDTSPIVRGVWVLENILGIAPPEPPADVEPLEPDIRGTKSVKERLRVHREKESCNECHRKIDYLGMTLENFDPIGQWRSHYDKKKKVKVEASDLSPNGENIESVKQLKQFLLKRKSTFAKGLTGKLAAYGIGREISFKEKSDIDAIVEKLKEGDGLKDLLTYIVNSELFLNK